MPEKSNKRARYAFLDRVMSRFGSAAKVLTDQGQEFFGEFQGSSNGETSLEKMWAAEGTPW